jgi:AraC-like DNA-binding protein
VGLSFAFVTQPTLMLSNPASISTKFSRPFRQRRKPLEMKLKMERTGVLENMKLTFSDREKNAEFQLLIDETGFEKSANRSNRKNELLTIAWNRGQSQRAVVDEQEYIFPSNTMLPLMANQSLHFSCPEDVIAWQFNRDFYCIITHDHEVSCVGFLFYGSSQTMFIDLDQAHQRKIQILFEVFKDEFQQADHVQGEMLRMLLVRLIITLTRLGKQQYAGGEPYTDDHKFQLFRQFNLLVELHYRNQHDVQFYAEALHRSSKTVANVFALYGKKSPSQIIHERIALEARRLFYYTDKSAKEVYTELGFEDAAHFSRFFKKHTNLSPSEFKKSILLKRHKERTGHSSKPGIPLIL